MLKSVILHLNTDCSPSLSVASPCKISLKNHGSFPLFGTCSNCYSIMFVSLKNNVYLNDKWYGLFGDLYNTKKQNLEYRPPWQSDMINNS